MVEIPQPSLIPNEPTLKNPEKRTLRSAYSLRIEARSQAGPPAVYQPYINAVFAAATCMELVVCRTRLVIARRNVIVCHTRISYTTRKGSSAPVPGFRLASKRHCAEGKPAVVQVDLDEDMGKNIDNHRRSLHELACLVQRLHLGVKGMELPMTTFARRSTVWGWHLLYLPQSQFRLILMGWKHGLV